VRPARLRQGLRRLSRAFQRDQAGIAAVEFGYIVPVILLMFVGTVEISRAVSMNRRFDLVTSMVADLVAREKSMTAADLTAVYKIVSQVMNPFDASSLKVSVIPVKASPTDATNTLVYAATTNRPSYNGGSQPAKCAAYGLTQGLVPKGSSVIVVESSYTYTPIVANYVIGSAVWTSKAIVSPRNSCVDFDGDNCVSTCF
jgi:Flp pilus assembly protein TadG